MNKYACLKKQEFADGDYLIVPLREEDIFLIMKWRNQQMDILRQKVPLTEKSQQHYYQEVIRPSFIVEHPSQILFSFFLRDKFIGYGGFVHVHWQDRRGEMSFLADTERANNLRVYEEDFVKFLRLIKMVAFEYLEFNRISGETFDIRYHHIAIMEKNGFQCEGRLREHVFIGNKYVDSLMHGCLKKDIIS